METPIISVYTVDIRVIIKSGQMWAFHRECLRTSHSSNRALKRRKLLLRNLYLERFVHQIPLKLFPLNISLLVKMLSSNIKVDNGIRF